MLRAGCYVARQEVCKVAGTCVFQLVMPEKYSGRKNVNRESCYSRAQLMFAK